MYGSCSSWTTALPGERIQASKRARNGASTTSCRGDILSNSPNATSKSNASNYSLTFGGGLDRRRAPSMPHCQTSNDTKTQHSADTAASRLTLTASPPTSTTHLQTAHAAELLAQSGLA